MYRSRETTKAYKKELKNQKQTANPVCVFCDPEPERIIETGQTMYVLRNKYPYQYWEHVNVTDHLMVVPKRHIESIGDLTNDEKVEAMDLFSKYESAGYNVYGRAKENHMKTMPHQHTHLIKIKGKHAKIALFIKKPYTVWKI